MKNRFRFLALVCGLALAAAAIARGSTTSSHSTLGEQELRQSANPSVTSNGTANGSRNSSTEIVRVLGALALVIGLILVLRWLGGRLFRGARHKAAGNAIEVLTRCAISPRQQVIVLRIGRRIVLIGDSGSGLTALCEITDPDEISALAGELGQSGMIPRSNGWKLSRHAVDRGEEADSAEPQAKYIGAVREQLRGLRERVKLLAGQLGT